MQVEHSNEVWNGGFESGKYASKRGLELQLATDEITARYRYHALRWAWMSHSLFITARPCCSSLLRAS
jgi:hypothetical protein